MPDLLQEFVDSRGVNVAVDRDAGILRGVKILGLRSRNGRTYQPQALTQAVALYEDAKVNVNHPKGGPLAPRDYQERIGRLTGVEFRSGDGLYADFRFNPKHPLAEQLIWDAENAPENVGFSHNVQGRTASRDGQTVVESIEKVQSVDLVADPATTRGLFESQVAQNADRLAELTLEQLKNDRPDLVEAVQQEQLSEQQHLQEEVEQLRIREAAHQRRQAAVAMLAQAGLPNPDSSDAWSQAIVGEQFMQSLISATNEAEMRRLVEDRARVVEGARRIEVASPNGHPRSRPQLPPGVRRDNDPREQVSSTAHFVRAIS